MRYSKPVARATYYVLLVLMVLALLVDSYVVCSLLALQVRSGANLWLSHFIVTAVGYTANAFVVIGVVGSKKMRASPVNLLLLNLAVSDFLYIVTNDRVGIHDWPPWMINRLWGFARYMCPVNRYVSSAAFMASIGTFVAIAIERYVVTVRPLHARLLCSRSRQCYCVLAIWIFAFVFELPNYVAYDAFDAAEYYSQEFNATLHYNLTAEESYTHAERPRICINPSRNAASWKVFKWVEFGTSYIFPIVVAVALYPRTCRAVWAVDPGVKANSVKSVTISNASSAEACSSGSDQDRRQIVATTTKSAKFGTGPKASSAEPRCSDSYDQDRRQIVKMLIVCVVAFFVGYTPVVVIFVRSELFPTGRHRYDTEFVLVASELVKYVCALNPFIYTLFSHVFRHRVKEVVTCRQTIDVFLALLFLVEFYVNIVVGHTAISELPRTVRLNGTGHGPVLAH